MRSPADLTDAFREQGMKITPQRQLLFRLLHGHEGHPTADSLFAEASRQMPGISLRTVYQTLNDLASMGELQVIGFADGPTRFDPNTVDHHHAECASCGDLRDVYLDPEHTWRVDGLDGFQPHGTHILFRGLCGSCAAAASPSPTSTLTN